MRKNITLTNKKNKKIKQYFKYILLNSVYKFKYNYSYSYSRDLYIYRINVDIENIQ